MRRLALLALAACHPTPSPAPVAPAPRVAVAPDAAPVAPDAPARVDLTLGRTLLANLGAQTTRALEAQFPIVDREVLAKAADLVALGPCTRPTATERAAIAKRLAAADRKLADAGLTFGCVDPGGTIVAVATEWERKDRHMPDGIWRVLRVSAKRVETLGDYTGTPTSYWSEYADEASLAPIALVDLDGDGDHDAILALDRHEGGSSVHDVTLSTWLSSTRRRSKPLGTFGDDVDLARGPTWAPHAPVVLAIDPHDSPSESRPRSYRCIEPDGALDVCKTVEEAHRIDEALVISGWFVDGTHEFGAHGERLPDREELAGLLDTLQTPLAARTALLAAMPVTTPGMRVAAIVERALAPKQHRQFGELVDPPFVDPRPAMLTAALGDAVCSGGDRAHAVAPIAKWIAAHARDEATALVAHGDCEDGKPCKFATSKPPAITQACLQRGAGYVAARWLYPARGSEGQIVARDGVFYIDARGAASAMATGTASGYSMECNACDGPPPPQLDARFLRRAGSVVALVLGARGEHRTLTYAHDGIAATVPATEATAFMAFAIDGDTLPDVVRIEADAWHWDGAAWTTLPKPAKDAADPAAAWLWHAARYDAAVDALHAFDAASWDDVPGRAAVIAALATLADERALATVVGADDDARAFVTDLAARP